MVQSSVDVAFWAELGNLKLDKLRLSEDPQHITGEACSGKVSPCAVLVILFGTEQHFIFLPVLSQVSAALQAMQTSPPLSWWIAALLKPQPLPDR